MVTIIVLRLQGFRILKLCFLPFLIFTTIFTWMLSPDLLPRDPSNRKLYFHNIQSFSINLQSIAQRNWIISISCGFIYLNLLERVSDWNKMKVKPLLMVTVTSIHYQFCEGGNKKLWENTMQLAFIWQRGRVCGSSSLPSIRQ